MANGQLHSNCVIDVIRHGHAAPAPVDFDRTLSEKGRAQASMLGRILPRYDGVFTSAAPRAQDTARIAIGCRWQFRHLGVGRELYCPKSDADFAEIFRLTEVVGEGNYGAYLDADKSGVFRRYMAESRELVLGAAGIEDAQRIAIFAHAIMGNALAEAFFPKHAAALRTINLAPCDRIQVSTTACRHIPLES